MALIMMREKLCRCRWNLVARVTLMVVTAALARADVTLAPLFGDYAVMQRNQPIPIWGRAEPGERISVSFGGQTTRTRAATDGRWSVSLPPMEVSEDGRELVVQGKSRVALREIVVGDVWLCSGQSNMGRTVEREIQGGVPIAMESLPMIRQFLVERAVAEAPAGTLKSGGWKRASLETTGAFTAVGYLFAWEIHRELGVPIGLIHSSWGGTPIESWTDSRILASDTDPAFAGVRAWWRGHEAAYSELREKYVRDEAAWIARGRSGAAPRAPHGGPGDHWRPGVLYNAMIHPLVPYGLKGVLWYQGENNANDRRAEQYFPVFSAMIRDWREKFRHPELPFLWVQLPNYKTDKDWPGLREAQSDTLALPHTGEAVTIDIGDPNDIHPHNKIEVARRLALVAKATVYGFDVTYAGPRFVSARREGRALRVSFAHAEGGLAVRGETVNDVELAGADRVFHPAEGRIDGETLIVTSPSVPEPVAVRYAWSNNPSANLYNRAGLPAAPFRSERW